MYRIRQEGFPMQVCQTEQQFAHHLKIAKGRKRAFNRPFKTYRLVKAHTMTGTKWEEFGPTA